MSKEFMERSLFRPFKTTKKQGMGIGLFQSKMIVEAHGGRIEVESEEGKGSTFRVFLPVGERVSGVGGR
jgi:signal transduction histidine kinase